MRPIRAWRRAAVLIILAILLFAGAVWAVTYTPCGGSEECKSDSECQRRCGVTNAQCYPNKTEGDWCGYPNP